MAAFIFFSALPSRRAGYALLQVENWTGETADVELSIRRNSSPSNLDAEGKWSGEPHWLRFGNGTLLEGRLAIEVGPAIVDAMLHANRNSLFQVEVRKPGGSVTKYPVRSFPNDVTPSTAAGEAPAQERNVDVAPVAPPPPVEAPPAPVIPDVPQKPQPEFQPDPLPLNTGGAKRKSTTMVAIVAGVLALLIAAGIAAWFFLKKDNAPEPPPKSETPVATPTPAPAPAAVACSKDSLSTAAEMTFVQDCVRDVQDPTALLAIIQAARDAGKCSIAQRLYANRAQAGSVPIALAYAQEYDPATYKENVCFKADAATAAYWYQAVLEKDKGNAQAQARLKELPK